MRIQAQPSHPPTILDWTCGRKQALLLLDGGLGTTLTDVFHHTFTSTITPTWSSHLLISSPATLAQAHKAFADAGADIILTATYQASVEGFGRTRRCRNNGIGDGGVDRSDGDGEEAGGGGGGGRGDDFYSHREAVEIMRSAVPLARTAFGHRQQRQQPQQQQQQGKQGLGLVGLSLAAYGATLVPSAEYSGVYPPEMGSVGALESWHGERIRVFEGHEETWKGLDLVAFETLPRLDEVRAVRGAMGMQQSGRCGCKPFWISCVFPNEDERLPDGSEVIQVLETMLGRGSLELPLPMGIGINCTRVQKLRSLITKFEDAAAYMQLPLPHLVVYPDGATNLKYDTASQEWIPQRDVTDVRDWGEEMLMIVEEVQKRDRWEGIVVGGCCKTTPENIATLRKRIDEKIGM